MTPPLVLLPVTTCGSRIVRSFLSPSGVEGILVDFGCCEQDHAYTWKQLRDNLLVLLSQPLLVMEFAFPIPLRDELVASTLAGMKSTTTGLLAEYRVAGEALPAVGLRQGLVNSAGEVVGVIETTAVQVVRLVDVPMQHALDEGEGHESLALWRRAHEQFWSSAQFREILDDPGFIVNNDTEVVLERFTVIEDAEFV